MARRFSTSVLVLLVALTLAGCPRTAPVTLHGQPVTNAMVATATRVAQVADLASAGVVRGIQASYKAGVISEAVAQAYVVKIGPRVQTSLDSLKQVLIILEQSPHATTAEKLAEAMLLVQEAVAMAQEYMTDPVAWVQKHGGTP